jgi:flavin-dependent dehydrogenase
MDMRKHLDNFIQRNKVLRNYLSIDIKGYPIPIKPISRILARGRTMLIGDAAGFSESFTGEGIYYAFWSANCAHRTIVRHIFNSEPLTLYNQYIRPIANNLFFARLTACLFYSIARFGYYHMVRNKWVNYYFAQLIYGKVNFIRCFLEIVLFAPLWIFAPRYHPIDDSHLK